MSSFKDPYIDPNTGILINLTGAKTKEELDQREADFATAGLVSLTDICNQMRI